MKTGIFFRVQRGDKWLAMDVVDMTPEEQLKVLGRFYKDALIRTIQILLKIMSGQI